MNLSAAEYLCIAQPSAPDAGAELGAPEGWRKIHSKSGEHWGAMG